MPREDDVEAVELVAVAPLASVDAGNETVVNSAAVVASAADSVGVRTDFVDLVDHFVECFGSVENPTGFHGAADAES